MKTSYKKEDVKILLKDITGQVEPMTIDEREKSIQSNNKHYSEMLPIEKAPTAEYENLYNESLINFHSIVGDTVIKVSDIIYNKKGNNITLVSLARAGTPIGILIKNCLKFRYNLDCEHYTISIIRDRGIDKNAMDYILERHKADSIQFVDGWTGKGAILYELKKVLDANNKYENISRELAVLSDPAYVTDICGTHEDFLIPSSCLNSTVSGLISRTFLREDVINETDFHGSMYYKEFEEIDKTYEFIDKINEYVKEKVKTINKEKEYEELKEEEIGKGRREVEKIAKEFNIEDINLVKPGIGETTRVLLRRKPWKILVHNKNDLKYLGHLLKLAEEKGVEVIEYPLKAYRACGVIKDMSADI